MNDSEGRKYQILNTIATGGTAVLYKAIQTSLDRPVVIKRLHAHLTSDSNFTRRFELEAKSAASLDHENIVRIIDFGSTQGSYYIVMEYIGGLSLKEVLEKRGVLGEELALLIAHEICMGLDHAHQNGIIHRDIKPANIMITGEGQVKITDFGLAKLHQSQTQQTVANTLLGTPLYMSPEQAIGDSIDGRSDLFSLGTICYEMTTGTQPFRGENYAAVIQNILQSSPPPPSKIGKELSPEAEMIVMKALNHEPSKRFRTALEMARAIESHIGQDKVLVVRDKLRRLVSGEGKLETSCIKPKVKKESKLRKILPLVVGSLAVVLGTVFFGLDPERIETLKSKFRETRAPNPLQPREDQEEAAENGLVDAGMMTPAIDPVSPAFSIQLPDSATGEAEIVALLEGVYVPADSAVYESPIITPIVEATDGKTQNVKGAQTAEKAPVSETGDQKEKQNRDGFLDLTVEPEAEILIDGKMQTYDSHLGLQEISAGKHEITCRKDGYKDYRETVTIKKGELSRRRIILEKETGDLQFETQNDVHIYIDDVFKGTTPLINPISLTVGSHKVELRKHGYNRWTNVVYIPPNETLSLKINLVPR